MTGESGAVNTFFMLKQPHSGTKIARIRVCQRNDQYGYSDPVLNTDPSGHDPTLPCKPFDITDPLNPATCKEKSPPTATPPRPIPSGRPTEAGVPPAQYIPSTSASPTCPSTSAGSPLAGPIDTGYLEGVVFAPSLAVWTLPVGWEEVYDLYDFEYGRFSYEGQGPSLPSISISAGSYLGFVTGWSSPNFTKPGVHNYSGPFSITTQSPEHPF